MASIDGELVDLVSDVAVHPGDSATFDRTFGGMLGEIIGTYSSSSQVTTTQTVFYGVECSSGAAVTVNLYVGTSSTGAAFFSRVVSSGNGYAPVAPIYCSSGIFLSPSSTSVSVSVIALSS